MRCEKCGRKPNRIFQVLCDHCGGVIVLEQQPAPAQQAPLQQPALQPAPAQQAPLQQPALQPAPAQQAPLQQAPVQQAPVQQVPVQPAPFGTTR